MYDKMKVRKGRRNRMWMILGAIFIFLVIVVLIVIPPSMGKVPPIRDEEGNIVEGSVSEKLFLDMNDTTLGMFLVGKDITKPVLLFLGGGPGIPEYFLEREYPTGIENEFVVCYLEYRGTSLSYRPDMDAASMTTQQYIEDVVAVTKYLSDRFGQDKIYLMGHSFGTGIGLRTVSLYPELYQAYIAISQKTNQRESEYLAYDYMLEQYQKAGNKKRIKQFEECPIRESEEMYRKYKSSMLRDEAMHELGVGTARNMDSVITGIFLPSLRCTAYTPIERIHIWRGKAFANTTPVDHDEFNAFEEIQKVEIPIYFLAGKYDYTCCYSLQKEYYEMVQAPVKGFYTFENSAHSPLFEEPDKGLKILTQDVLKGTNLFSDK